MKRNTMVLSEGLHCFLCQHCLPFRKPVSQEHQGTPVKRCPPLRGAGVPRAVKCAVLCRRRQTLVFFMQVSMCRYVYCV